MGQRHQVFVITPNGGNFKKPKESKEYKNHVSKYGSKETIVFPYHHQWLYGFTALCNCMNLLVMGRKLDYEDEQGYHFNRYPDVLQSIQNLTPINGKITFQSVSFEGDEFPKMRFNFDIGDNNDGVTIVFPKEKKYCFMFINEPIEGNEDRVPYQPMSGKEYLKCYYPDDYDKDPFYLPMLNRFEKYTVLTKSEIKKLFPRMKLKPVMG